MPIYEFHCDKCESDFEELVLRKDEKIQCPKCSNPDVQKKMSVFSHRGPTNGLPDMSGSSHSGSSCSGCSGGSCSTCH